MAKRIMMVLTPDTVTDFTRAALDVARAARHGGGRVRIVYVSPIPPARLDRHDRVVADTDREMVRIAAGAEERLRLIAAHFDGVPVELAVRFGRLRRELAVEADAFGADLVVLTAPAWPTLRQRVLEWSLGGLAAPSRGLMILLPPAGRVRGRSRDDLAPATLA